MDLGEGQKEELQVSFLSLNVLLLFSQPAGAQSHIVAEITILPGLVFRLLTELWWYQSPEQFNHKTNKKHQLGVKEKRSHCTMKMLTVPSDV